MSTKMDLNALVLFYEAVNSQSISQAAARLRVPKSTVSRKISVLEHQVGSTLVFALPGNPASVTSCYYQYVYPALRRMQGFRSTFLKKVHLPLREGFVKKEGLTFFLKAVADETGVLPLSGQLSYIMSSFARANAVIMLEEHRASYEPGEVVEVHLLDHGRA